ncbi:hypothetical protein PHSY_002452 [Pseudozyma hubeiensis SY62]|uniref:Exonuclease V n=1 Tax=Pseudozyma hubeiensis (strain SY62) TaxID=1305764 RepID=R9P162_PSEHS|nr:hypothetical protein PHSY_002452 [Pseudozyma hubeiensis SY62]GAC94879.1 hypothetical protein PHSY_002452 [Pseudozyma hubeiensis SY62]
MTSSVPSVGTSRITRTRKSPPASLPDHFSRKGYLSVSDLVGPSWCEYNYQYGILSLSHLPPSLRPSTITTESGATLAAAPQLVAQKETTLNAGKAIHTVLEREVAPVQVVVETESREDAWALRLMNLWCDVVALTRLKAGKGSGKGKESCVREIPVYGWIQGVMVMGVIDEITKRTIEAGSSNREKGKTWSSQEEWKKEQLRKSSTSSPKKSKQANGSTTKPLTAFFGSSQPSQPDPPPQPQEHGWGYFLSDTKTRISSWLPAEEDQFSARMQCMTYKRLFDGLLLGALLSSPSSTLDSKTLSFDPNTTPMDWTETFASLDLDPDQPLSDVFLRDAMPVCESWGVELDGWVRRRGADVCTLDHVRLLLEEGLRMLVEDAGRGKVGKGEAMVIQDRLALTYRRQASRGKRGKRKKGSGTRRSARIAAESTTDTSTAKQTTLDEQLAIAKDDSTEDRAVELPTEEEQISVDDSQPLQNHDNPPGPTTDTEKKSLDALDGRNDAQHAIQETFSSPPLSLTPSRNRTHRPSPTPSPPASPTPPSSPSIIGIVSFAHTPSTLDAYLRRMISMWKGERSLIGVRADQTRRCWTCEWLDGCEWRNEQAQRAAGNRKEKSEQAEAKVSVAVEKDPEDAEGEEFWENVDYDSIEVRDATGKLVDW